MQINLKKIINEPIFCHAELVLVSVSKIDLDKSLSNLPKIIKNTQNKELSIDELKQKFYNDLGIKKGGVFIDKVGDPTIIDDELFKADGFEKLTKKDRQIYLDEFASVIKDPDEIYLEFEKLKNKDDKYIHKSHRLVKKFFKYYKYYQDENGKKRALLAIFEYLKDKTQGISLYFVDTAKSVEKKRMDKLVWQKELKQD